MTFCDGFRLEYIAPEKIVHGRLLHAFPPLPLSTPTLPDRDCYAVGMNHGITGCVSSGEGERVMSSSRSRGVLSIDSG